MINLSNSKLLSMGVVLLSLLLTAKMAALALWWYLPNEGIDLKVKKSFRIPYVRVDFKNMLVAIHLPKKTGKKKTTNASSIDNMILKGLYGNTKSGFAIVAQKASSKKTTIVGIGEEFGGYKLKAIQMQSVIFTRAGKEYILKLESKQNSSKYVSKVQTRNANAPEDEYSVSKNDIRYYSQHPTQIWRDIAISEIKKNGTIAGFRVNRIRPNSKMATIGLKVGDVIVKANNVELKSYRDAIKLYNEIDKIDVLELTVIRNNQEKEIVYEIH